MSFDYGAPVVSGVSEYKQWPTVGGRTALLDADFFPYIVGFCADKQLYAEAIAEAVAVSGEDEYDIELSTDDDLFYDALKETQGFKDVMGHCHYLVNAWVDGAKCQSAKLFMTEGRHNYRNDIAFTKKYKGNRQQAKPPFFYEARRYLVEQYQAEVQHFQEADDAMAIAQCESLKEESSMQLAGTCIVSKDKDLKIIPGWHYDPNGKDLRWVSYIGDLEPKWEDKKVAKYEDQPILNGEPIPWANVDELGLRGSIEIYQRGKRKGEFKLKRVKCGHTVSKAMKSLKGTGMKMFYAQLIMGDNADSIPGIKGAGAKLAYDTINDLTTEEDMFYAVLGIYKDHYGEGEFRHKNWRGGASQLKAWMVLLEQGRLLWMRREEGEIWRGNFTIPIGTNHEAWRD